MTFNVPPPSDQVQDERHHDISWPMHQRLLRGHYVANKFMISLRQYSKVGHYNKTIYLKNTAEYWEASWAG